MKHALPMGLSIMGILHFASYTLAETTVLTAVEDTSLHQLFADHNMGEQSHLASGSINQSQGPVPYRTRGLFKFDLNTLPVDATITAATVILEVTLVPPGGAASNFSLHRILTPWAEGTKVGNSGQPAASGESSWTYSSRPTAWQTPGGDFVATPSASTAVGVTTGPKVFPSTAVLLEDVEQWRSNPRSNFGWLLKSDSENVEQTARRWGSRESALAPKLEVEWEAAPPELRILDIEAQTGQISISFTGAEEVRVETKITLDQSEWQSLPTVHSNSPIILPQTGPVSFYRLVRVR
ncbi:MAG: DNRLRE domain-containing protein [Verrucomicrobiales bacterium]